MDFSNLLPFMNKHVANVADTIKNMWQADSPPEEQQQP